MTVVVVVVVDSSCWTMRQYWSWNHIFVPSYPWCYSDKSRNELVPHVIDNKSQLHSHSLSYSKVFVGPIIRSSPGRSRFLTDTIGN